MTSFCLKKGFFLDALTTSDFPFTPNLKYIIQMTVRDLNDLTYQAKVNLLKESLNYYLAKKKKRKKLTFTQMEKGIG